MVERVSEAIERLGPVDMANYRDRHRVARAAIGTLMEPDERMLRAADEALNGGSFYTLYDHIAEDDIKTALQAMISAALSLTEEPGDKAPRFAGQKPGEP